MRLYCYIIVSAMMALLSSGLVAESSTSPANTGPHAPGTSYSTLDELAGLSDIIIKAEAMASRPRDSANQFCSDYVTELRVISVLKGPIAEERIMFQHKIMPGSVDGHPPEHADFEVGRAYIVFAKKTAEPNGYGQVAHSTRDTRNMNQSPAVVLAANDQPIAGDKSIQDVIWEELTGLLKSSKPKDVFYAIWQAGYPLDASAPCM